MLNLLPIYLTEECVSEKVVHGNIPFFQCQLENRSPRLLRCSKKRAQGHLRVSSPRLPTLLLVYQQCSDLQCDKKKMAETDHRRHLNSVVISHFRYRYFFTLSRGEQEKNDCTSFSRGASAVCFLNGQFVSRIVSDFKTVRTDRCHFLEKKKPLKQDKLRSGIWTAVLAE